MLVMSLMTPPEVTPGTKTVIKKLLRSEKLRNSLLSIKSTVTLLVILKLI